MGVNGWLVVPLPWSTNHQLSTPNYPPRLLNCEFTDIPCSLSGGEGANQLPPMTKIIEMGTKIV